MDGEGNGRRMVSITSLTPTICALMAIRPPALANVDVLDTVIGAADGCGARPIDRGFVYAPDAIGTYLCRKHRQSFNRVVAHAPIQVHLRSVLPPKTPVCYASMFTGAQPFSHGLREYDKRMLTCDTLFDALIRGRRSIAIVAVKDSSIDRIFRGRHIDYFSETYDEQVTDRALNLIEAGAHDFIVAYNQRYDDAVHATSPRSSEAIDAMEGHIDSFVAVAEALEAHWKGHSRLIAFTPDHGAHVDPVTGKGTHGEDIPEDVYVDHFFGIATGEP